MINHLKQFVLECKSHFDCYPTSQQFYNPFESSFLAFSFTMLKNAFNSNSILNNFKRKLRRNDSSLDSEWKISSSSVDSHYLICSAANSDWTSSFDDIQKTTTTVLRLSFTNNERWWCWRVFYFSTRKSRRKLFTLSRLREYAYRRLRQTRWRFHIIFVL